MHEISQYIKQNLIIELSGTDKSNALSQLYQAIKSSNLIPNHEEFYKKIIEREDQSSTGIGLGVAVPHARLSDLEEMIIAIGRSSEGIDFETPDGTPVYLVFMIAVNADRTEYLKVLSRISWLVRNDQFRSQLLSCPTSELYRLLSNPGKIDQP